MLATCLKTDNLPLTVMGLCPLLLVSSTTINTMVMGCIFFIVLVLSSFLLSLIRHLVPLIMRLPIILLLIAFVVNLVDLFVSAFYYEWHLTLGIYIPLLSMNCLILVNAEEYCLRHGLKKVITQSLVTGLSIWGVLLVTGLIRDIMSGLLIGERNFVMIGMAPGAFLVLGFVIAFIQYINIKTTRKML